MFKWTANEDGRATWKARVPQGTRVYAIGDVHGQVDLLSLLLKEIWDDSCSRGDADVHLIFLGDLIDRGQKSAELISKFSSMPFSDKVVFLQGNHEWALVNAYLGDRDMAKWCFKFGGAATLSGFGCDVNAVDPNDGAAIVSAIRRAVPQNVFEWLAGLPTSHKMGDYFFVHAGVRPGVALERQNSEDVLWIREPFLSSRKDHGRIVVHGHSIETGDCLALSNRIGVDSGAYKTGILTAVGLDGADRWILKAEGAPLAHRDADEQSQPVRRTLVA